MTPVELAKKILNIIGKENPVVICQACLHIIQLVTYVHDKKHAEKKI
jgi:hypothetical protein